MPCHSSWVFACLRINSSWARGTRSLRWLAVSLHLGSLCPRPAWPGLGFPFVFIQRPQNCWPKIIQASLKSLPREPELTWFKNTFRRIAGAGQLEIIKNTDPFRCLHCRSKKHWSKVLKQYQARQRYKNEWAALLSTAYIGWCLPRQHPNLDGT